MSISHAQAEHWQQFGWITIPGLFGPKELKRIAGNLEFLTSSSNRNGHSLHYFEHTSTGPAICRTERFLEDSPFLSEIILGERLLDVAGILAGEQVVLFKEKINYKQPGGAGFSAHQDAAAYDFVDHHITCLVCLDPMTEENGCLQLAPGHRYGMMPTNHRGCIPSDFADSLEWHSLPLESGDALFFDSYTPHRSGPNMSDGPRRAIYLTYNVASEGDKRSAYYENRSKRMAGEDGPDRISTIGHFLGKNVAQRG